MPDSTTASSLLIRHMRNASLLIDPTRDQILYANPACCALLDWSLEALLKQRASCLWGHDLGALVTFTEEIQAHGHAWSDNLGLLDRERHRLEVEVSGSRLQHEGVELLGFYEF